MIILVKRLKLSTFFFVVVVVVITVVSFYYILSITKMLIKHFKIIQYFANSIINNEFLTIFPPELPPRIVFNNPNIKLPESNIGFGVLALSPPSSSGGGGYK